MSKIVETKVQPIFRRLYCEDCNVEMLMDLNHPEQKKKYKCSSCGKEEHIETVYPHIDFIDVDEE